MFESCSVVSCVSTHLSRKSVFLSRLLYEIFRGPFKPYHFAGLVQTVDTDLYNNHHMYMYMYVYTF